RHRPTAHGACRAGSASGGQDAAGTGHGDRRRRRASLPAAWVDEGRRDPRLRPLSRRAALRYDRLLEVPRTRAWPEHDPAWQVLLSDAPLKYPPGVDPNDTVVLKVVSDEPEAELVCGLL